MSMGGLVNPLFFEQYHAPGFFFCLLSLFPYPAPLPFRGIRWLRWFVPL